jgi:hypothetical protein
MAKKRYTYDFTRASVGQITVTASNDDDAYQDAMDILEECTFNETMVDNVDLTFKDVEPEGDDRNEDDL